jgi:hypothetical protein
MQSGSSRRGRVYLLFRVRSVEEGPAHCRARVLEKGLVCCREGVLGEGSVYCTIEQEHYSRVL